MINFLVDWTLGCKNIIADALTRPHGFVTELAENKEHKVFKNATKSKLYGHFGGRKKLLYTSVSSEL